MLVSHVWHYVSLSPCFFRHQRTRRGVSEVIWPRWSHTARCHSLRISPHTERSSSACRALPLLHTYIQKQRAHTHLHHPYSFCPADSQNTRPLNKYHHLANGHPFLTCLYVCISKVLRRNTCKSHIGITDIEPDEKCLSHWLFFHLPKFLRILSFPTGFTIFPLPFCYHPFSPSHSEISVKITEGQIRGWLPLCITSKDKYSQDDSQCPEDVNACAWSSPAQNTHTHTHSHIHIKTQTCICKYLCYKAHCFTSALSRVTEQIEQREITSYVCLLLAVLTFTCVCGIVSVCMQQVMNGNSCFSVSTVAGHRKT